eukprot:scaffold77466_cov26-Tisochrysis_lutea.AAC.5
MAGMCGATKGLAPVSIQSVTPAAQMCVEGRRARRLFKPIVGAVLAVRQGGPVCAAQHGDAKVE